MKPESRARHLFRAITRHKDEVDELKTPAIPVERPQVPHNPNKKRSFLRRNTNDITPTTKKSHHNRNILTNSTNVTTSNAPEGCSTSLTPAVIGCNNTNANNITNTSTTTAATDDVVIKGNLGSAGINSYDYKTFSTTHPLRISKIKALEQSEMTSRMYFQKFELDDEESDDDLIVQIPNLSKEETKNLIRGDTIENQVYRQSGSLDRRLNVMRNAFKPVSEVDLILSKLQSSKLPNVFQNCPDFLKTLGLEDLEFWEALNDEFDTEMKDMAVELNNETKRQNCLSNSNGGYTLIDAPFDQLYEPSPWRRDLGAVLSQDVRKKVKRILNTNEE